MYKPTKPYRKFLVALTILAAAGTGCSKDKESRSFSASREIMKSETLTIPAAVDLPANLPGGNSRVATYYAEGVQQYKARIKAGSSPVAYEWVFVAPQANLYNISGKKAGTHSAGPTWQLSATDSIYAQHFTPVKSAPAPEPGSIDWLLLMPKTGKTPTGLFAEVDYIQRIATVGGKAPAVSPQNENETAGVPYTAVYRFSRKNP